MLGIGRTTVELAKETGPDVVILDAEMPVMGVLGGLLRLSPPKVVILAVFAEQRLVRELLGLGASALLTKSASSQDLVSAVRSVSHVPPRDPDNVTRPRELRRGVLFTANEARSSG